MEKKKVMIVDDTPENLRILHRILKKEDYIISVFPNPLMALNAAEKIMPDLFLLDIMMPEMNGYELCRKLKESRATREIPVLFISALTSVEDKMEAFKAGGEDFITKPFYPEEVVARVNTHIRLYRMNKLLKDYNRQLQKKIQEKVREVEEAKKASLTALTEATGQRDKETGEHIERVQQSCHFLAMKLQEAGIYGEYLNDEYISHIYFASSLHDVGKVGIPDQILHKPGKLTEEEFDVIKTHVTLGFDMIERIQVKYPQNKILDMGKIIALYHHEKWDGTGYPKGLKGEEIPLSARIMALVDVYDALRSERPYKKGLSHEEALRIISEGKGKHFDPELTAIFLNHHDQFRLIFDEMRDQEVLTSI